MNETCFNTKLDRITRQGNQFSTTHTSNNTKTWHSIRLTVSYRLNIFDDNSSLHWYYRNIDKQNLIHSKGVRFFVPKRITSKCHTFELICSSFFISFAKKFQLFSLKSSTVSFEMRFVFWQNNNIENKNVIVMSNKLLFQLN